MGLITHIRQYLYGTLIQFLLTLNGINIGTHFNQNTGLISRSGTDLEYFISFVYLQQLSLVGNSIGLRDGLFLTYRKSNILIGLVPESFIKKEMPRHFAYGFQDAFIFYTFFLQQLNQPLSGATLTVVIEEFVRHF